MDRLSVKDVQSWRMLCKTKQKKTIYESDVNICVYTIFITFDDNNAELCV